MAHYGSFTMLPRIVIDTQDAVELTGKSKLYMRKVFAKIRKMEGKKPRAYVTDEEFAKHTGIKLDTIKKYLNPRAK